MSCAEYGSGLVIVEDSHTCTPCERIELVPQDDSVMIMQSILIEGRENLTKAIAPCDPNSVMEAAFVHRGQLARDFISRYTSIDMEVIIGTTAILRKLLQALHASGCRRANAYKAGGLIRSHNTLISAWNNLSSLRAGTHRMIHSTRHDLVYLRGLRPSDFSIYPGKKYVTITGTFAKHGMMTGADAKRKIREEYKEWAPTELGSKKTTSLEQAISTFHHVSNMLSVSFTANRMRQKTFSLPGGCDIPVGILESNRFIADMPLFHGGIAWSHESDFGRVARSWLGDQYAAFALNFVVGHGNPRALPLFLKHGSGMLRQAVLGGVDGASGDAAALRGDGP